MSGISPGIGVAESSDAACASSPGMMKPNPKLPDPFMMHDGRRITTKADWPCRRSEIKRDLEQYEIGPKPAPPTIEARAIASKPS
jgi:hypothetical protein